MALTTNSDSGSFFGAASSAQAHVAMETKQKTPPRFLFLIISLFIAGVGVVYHQLITSQFGQDLRAKPRRGSAGVSVWGLKLLFCFLIGSPH